MAPTPKPPLRNRLQSQLAKVADWPWATILFVGFLVIFGAVMADEALARSGGSGGGGFSRGGGGGFGGGGGSRGGGGFGFFACGYVSPQLIMMIFFVMIVMAVVQWAVKRSKDAARVYRIRFGISQPGAKPWEELEPIVRRASFDSPEALATFVRNVTLYLRRKGDRLTHASIQSTRKLSSANAETEFRALSNGARATFDREVLRVEGRGKLLEQKREAARKDELTDEDGEFGINEFFVVTLVVGVDNSVPLFPESLTSRDALSTTLDRLSGLSAPAVLAAEVVWTPAAESDILTADEVLASFPDLGEVG